MNELNIKREDKREEKITSLLNDYHYVLQIHIPPSTGHNKILGVASTAAISWQSRWIQSCDILTSVPFLGSGRKFTLLCLWKAFEFWGFLWHVSHCYKMKNIISCFLLHEAISESSNHSGVESVLER